MIKKMIWLCLVVSSLANIACGEQPSSYDKRDKKIMNNLTLYFHKETGAQFITRTQAVSSNPLPTSTTTFYNLDWDKHPIDLQIDHGQHSITLHHVIGLQTGDGNKPVQRTGIPLFRATLYQPEKTDGSHRPV